MPERARLLQSIAAITRDYRAGALPSPTPAHVERWINQFPHDRQQPILAEMEYVLGKTYVSQAAVKSFLTRLINHRRWTKGDPRSFWRQVNFLDIQPRGRSQTELLALFDAMLQEECGISIAECGQGTRFLYLDDRLFSGGRLGTDLDNWIKEAAPQEAQLLVALVALHTQGTYFTRQKLDAAIPASRKNITLRWAYQLKIEDGLFQCNNSDVLRPTGPGNDPAVPAYIESLGKDQTWRTGDSLGPKQFFSSIQGRELLEQEFLRQGVAIRAMCPYLNVHQKPLGNTTMRTTGFGTLFVTFRNCPNNAPLVLWAGDPWYPLFPRLTN
ncbi:hypothetical protein MKK58_12095 [Methylobacterium sp. J-078]|uniref:phosphoribosyltransferase-like protein n=1 Tax=Methylobacterium sp. J-078 TaxID=2836657 RepID=UPI001FBBA353|nr:hypothetical protein [Methylobacterium sp. J-078]MCJ2045266.1 hypothetical protein [Methylobacterium sp. J-078]